MPPYRVNRDVLAAALASVPLSGNGGVYRHIRRYNLRGKLQTALKGTGEVTVDAPGRSDAVLNVVEGPLHDASLTPK